MSCRNCSRVLKPQPFVLALWLSLWLLAWPFPTFAASEHEDVDPAFRTDTRFTIDGEVHTSVSALAWIEEHFYFGPGYHRLTVGFYPFQLTGQQTREAAAGNYQPIEEVVTADTLSANYKSHVQVVLNIYEGNKVGHVDISIPGNYCTVAPYPNEVEDFLQEYLFENGRLRLKSRGAYACFESTPDNPDRTYRWDFDVDLPVFEFETR